MSAPNSSKFRLSKLNLILVFVFLIGIFLRLYKISTTQPFLMDEARDAYMVRGIITGDQYPLVGPTTSFKQIYLGPLYYYLLVPFLWLFQNYPLGITYASAITGIITLAVAYLVTKKLFSTETAILATGLYAISATAVNHSRVAWNPYFLPLLGILYLKIGSQIWRHRQSATTYPLLFLLIGIGWHFHATSLLLLVPTTILIISQNLPLNNRRRFIPVLKGLVIYGLLTLPFIWYQSTLKQNPNPSTASHLTFSFPDVLNHLSLLIANHLIPLESPAISLLLTAVLISAIIYQIKKTHPNFLSYVRNLTHPKKVSARLMNFTWILIFHLSISLPLIFLPIKVYPHYFELLLPSTFILIAYLITMTIKKLNPQIILMSLLLYLFTQFKYYSFHQPLDRQISYYQTIATQIETDALKDQIPYGLWGINSSNNYLAINYRYFLEKSSSLLLQPNQMHQADRWYIISDQPLSVSSDQQLLIENTTANLPTHVTRFWQSPPNTWIYRLDK